MESKVSKPKTFDYVELFSKVDFNVFAFNTKEL